MRTLARRIEGFVEVDLGAIRIGQSDVQEAAGAIGAERINDRGMLNGSPR
jgi:hypothetical protein